MRTLAQWPEVEFHRTPCLSPVGLPPVRPHVGFRIRQRSHHPFSLSYVPSSVVKASRLE